jgi:release factor glutamine methyltransferase
MTLFEKFKEISDILSSKGIEDPLKESELLLTEAIHIDKTSLYTKSIELSEAMLKKIDDMVKRRVLGEPIQYIIGYVNFYGLKINVGKGVLIPRPETELLVEETTKILLTHIISEKPLMILDICTGSGCIALSLAKEFPDAIVYGVDNSSTALEYAKRNALENKIKNVRFLKSDLFNELRGLIFDCIVSNPPYIKRGDIPYLQKEIKDYEPIEALDGGENGLNFYRTILKEARWFLKKKGVVVLEIGVGQDVFIREIAVENGFKYIKFIEDYSKIKRIFVGKIEDGN